MTIAELIAELQKQPQDMLVCVASPEGFDPEPVENVEREKVCVRCADGTEPYTARNFVKQDVIVLRAW